MVDEQVPQSETDPDEPEQPVQPEPPVKTERPEPPDAEEPTLTQVRLRRAPRYRAFVITGALTGVLAAALIVFLMFPIEQGASSGTVFLYFALGLALVGGLLGAGAALLVERRR